MQVMRRQGMKEGAHLWTFGLCRKRRKRWHPEKGLVAD